MAYEKNSTPAVSVKIAEITEKECSINIAYYGGNLTITVFDRSVGNSPAIRVAIKTDWDKLLVMLEDAIVSVLDSPEAKAVALTHNEFLKEQRQYKVTAVFIINKNKDGIYSLIAKTNSYTHEFIFTMTNTISIGSNGMTDSEKSTVAMKAFLARVKSGIRTITDIKVKEAMDKANLGNNANDTKDKPKDDFGFNF